MDDAPEASTRRLGARYLRCMAKKQALDWTLAPAPESTDHVKINAQYELFVNGKWQKPKSGKYFDTINPANACCTR